MKKIIEILESKGEIAAAGVVLAGGQQIKLVHRPELLPIWPTEALRALWLTFEAPTGCSTQALTQHWVLEHGFVWAFCNQPVSCLGVFLAGNDLEAEVVEDIRKLYCRHNGA